jgi:hypothetical protein
MHLSVTLRSASDKTSCAVPLNALTLLISKRTATKALKEIQHNSPSKLKKRLLFKNNPSLTSGVKTSNVEFTIPFSLLFPLPVSGVSDSQNFETFGK